MDFRREPPSLAEVWRYVFDPRCLSMRRIPPSWEISSLPSSVSANLERTLAVRVNRIRSSDLAKSKRIGGREHARLQERARLEVAVPQSCRKTPNTAAGQHAQTSRRDPTSRHALAWLTVRG